MGFCARPSSLRPPALAAAASACLALLLTAASASAQSGIEGFDSNATPAPIAPTPFSALEATSPLPARTLSAGLRASVFTQPISLVLPAPGDQGTRSSVVGGVLLGELTVAAGLGLNIDAGMGLSLHAYQWGAGLSPVTGGTQLAPVAFADPRFQLGYGRIWGAFGARAYGTLFAPLGDTAAFAGAGSTRAELGLASRYDFGRVLVEVDLAVRLQPQAELGYSRIGNQLKLGAGALVRLTPYLQIGPELLFLPILVEQAAPPQGSAPLQLPSEARLTVRATWETWALLASGGSGLPFSHPSSLDEGAGLTRGLTSPTFRGLLELRTTF